MPPKLNLERVDIEVETAEMLAAISKIDSNRLQVDFIYSIILIDIHDFSFVLANFLYEYFMNE